MYRSSIDNAIAYTAEDLILFMESPFASWMERLTLENANHGIAPDPGTTPPEARTSGQHGAIKLPFTAVRGVESLGWREFVHIQTQSPGRASVEQITPGEIEGVDSCDIALIELDGDEAQRRSATLAAMQRGADFIVNGQLAEATLSDSVDLLMRSAGNSAFGDYLYIPCYTRGANGLHTPFHLCYAADLLEFRQQILPPQMLVICHDGNILPQQTRGHIYHYRAVKRRFVEAQQAFRKHRMPDPAESSHFGRWSDCANAVLRQRALAKQRQVALPPDSTDKPETRQSVAIPAKVPSQKLAQQPAKIALKSRETASAELGLRRQSRIDLDAPEPLDARLFTGPHDANQRPYDSDNYLEELSTSPFDSTLKTSDGLGW